MRVPFRILLLATMLTGSLLAQDVTVSLDNFSGFREKDGQVDVLPEDVSYFITIDVPSVSSEEDTEYTVPPFVFLLSEVQWIDILVGHSYDGSDCFLFNYSNLNQLSNTSFSFKCDNGEGTLFNVKGKGEVTVDFSYKKTTPAHHEGWFWTLVPQRTATTTVHVPIKIVDHANFIPDPSSNEAPSSPSN